MFQSRQMYKSWPATQSICSCFSSRALHYEAHESKREIITRFMYQKRKHLYACLDRCVFEMENKEKVIQAEYWPEINELNAKVIKEKVWWWW